MHISLRKIHKKSFSGNDRKTIGKEHSERIFKFGGGEKRKSLGVLTLPCFIAGKNVWIRTEVVDAEFPLLLGNSMLKKAHVVLHLSAEKAMIRPS